MTNKRNYDNRLAKFEFTKSPANGRFNMKSLRSSYLTYMNGKPDDIAKWFGEILQTTLEGMEDNGARKITMICRWQ